MFFAKQRFCEIQKNDVDFQHRLKHRFFGFAGTLYLKKEYYWILDIGYTFKKTTGLALWHKKWAFGHFFDFSTFTSADG